MVRTTAVARCTGEARVTPSTRLRAGGQVLRRLVLLEVAAALGLVGAVAGRAALVTLGFTAAVLVAAAVVRGRGGALPERSAAVLVIRRRRRRARSAPPGLLDPVLGPLGECDPALRTYSYAARGGRGVGMAGDGTFLTAVLAVGAGNEPLRPAQSLPLGPLLDALDVEDVGLASVQVVQHVRSPALTRVLPGADGPVPRYGIPAARLTWVALRLDPEVCPAAVLARGGGLGGAQRAVLRAADHLASRLTGAGFDAAVLDEEQLIAALAMSTCSEDGPEPAGRERHRTAEHRDAWHCDGLRHTTFALDDVLAAAGAVATLTPAQGTAWSFALTLARGAGGTPLVGGYMRVTAVDDRELTAACGELEAAVRRQGVEPARLDHEQVPGVLATVPLGGTR